jgi:hypothetical protein
LVKHGCAAAAECVYTQYTGENATHYHLTDKQTDRKNCEHTYYFQKLSVHFSAVRRTGRWMEPVLACGVKSSCCGPRAGRKALTLYSVPPMEEAPNIPLLARLAGFSLHAASVCEAHRCGGHEHLCLYRKLPGQSHNS